MSKVEIRKWLPNKQSKIEGIDAWGGEDFIPIFNLYIDDKRVGQYINVYDAAKEAFRQKDIDVVSIEYENNPHAFDSTSYIGNFSNDNAIPIDDFIISLVDDKSVLQRLIDKAQDKLSKL